MARVSVFIPTYNRARLLGFAIESVLAQTYGDFELVVSDNASTDETPDVVAGFDDPRLEYVRQPENLGLLERTVRALDERPRAGVAHAAFDVIGEDNEVLLPGVNWTYGLTDDAVES